ncbi:hypothetical protein GQ53DRAFT_837668 [Thozetella sp. PMI_491]|nr:hypothetical protein GQ53DRAFT_837668 [Thozetella sp. PMI_491]
MSSETEHNTLWERRPACDNCKARKTKCDRKVPCSSCTTLQVTCQTTRREPEKRQRVLLSTKYDEAVQDVSRQIGEVKDLVQKLVLEKGLAQDATKGPSSEYARHTPPSMIDEQVPNLSRVHDGFKGDSPFHSLAEGVDNALEATFASGAADLAGPSTAPGGQNLRELLQSAPTSEAATPDSAAAEFLAAQPESFMPGNMPLPPLDDTLKLLRVVKVERHRLFVIDAPYLHEDQFIDLCRDVYFTTDPISLWSWTCVNVGLYFLLNGLNQAVFAKLGMSAETIQAHKKLLTANAEAAMKSLRLCSEPSIESCRAITMLGAFYVKLGHGTMAWRLISAASRVALDLGLHRLSDNPDTRERYQKHLLFWYLYSWDKSLALTCGRTPVIHQNDVTVHRPPTLADTPPNTLYNSYIQYSLVAGEIQQTLFSASAQRMSQQDRTNCIQAFASRLTNVRETLRTIIHADPVRDEIVRDSAQVTDILASSLLTLVYRVLPHVPKEHSHPLQCSRTCVDAARIALSGFVRLWEKAALVEPEVWERRVNYILGQVPFVAFIVLAGNAIATSDRSDLPLLHSAVAALAPVALSSPTARKIHDACDRFARIAAIVLSNVPQGSPGHKHYHPLPSYEGLPLGVPVCQPNMQDPNAPLTSEWSFSMPQESWDSVMVGFESELGDYNPRLLSNVLEPYFPSGSW